MDLSNELVSVPEIFDGNFFRVPDYQRGYSWDEKQVNEFLSDIEHMVADSSPIKHFTGTLVLSRPSGSEGCYYVVDGQQRLTTLSILLNEIGIHLSEERRYSFRELYILRGGYGNEVQVLTLNQDVNDFFATNIIEIKPGSRRNTELEAHKKLKKARYLIKKWVSAKVSSSITVEEVLRTVEEKIGFLVYAPRETAETGIMFEVINNRGKPLSELEKVKNYLIYCSSKIQINSVREQIDSEWSRILVNLNKAQKTSHGEEGAFLRYCLIVFLQLNKHDSQYGYEQLKNRIDINNAIKNGGAYKKKIGYFISSLLKFLVDASQWYALLYAKGKHHGAISDEVGRPLSRLRAQDRHAAIMPVFLALTIKGQVSEKQLSRLLHLIEIVNFRVYMTKGITSRNDSGQAEIYRYAALYFNDKLRNTLKEEDPDVFQEKIYFEEDALEYYLVWFSMDFALDEKFIDSFSLNRHDKFDFFSWGAIRYFLMSYEEELQPNKTIEIEKILRTRKEGRSKDYYSVEHIWSRENRAKDGKNNTPSDKHERRRLGNFALLELRLNIQGKNKDIEEKIPIYVDGQDNESPSDLQQVREIQSDYKKVQEQMREWQRKTDGYYREMYQRLNDLREKRYVEFAKKRWSLSSFLGYRELVDYYYDSNG